MNYWRLGTVDSDGLAKVLEDGVWASTKESELHRLERGDRVVVFSLDKKRQGYWATARVVRKAYEVAADSVSKYHVDLELSHIRRDILPASVVRSLLQKARLRLNYPPLFVVQLSAGEYQAMSRLIESHD
jgi:hypothetical protein